MIRTKNYLYLLCIFLISTLFLLALFYNFAAKSLTESINNSAMNQMNYATTTLLNKIKNIEVLGMTLLTNDTVSLLNIRQENDYYDTYDYTMDLKLIKEEVSREANRDSNIQAIHIYWPDEDLVISSEVNDNVNQKDWIRELSGDRQQWMNNDDTLYYSTSYPFINFENEPKEYIVYIELTKDYLHSIQSITSNIPGSTSILKLPNGEILFSQENNNQSITNEVTQTSLQQELTNDNENITVLSNFIANSGIQLLTYYDETELLSPIRRTTQIVLIIFVILIVFGFILIDIFNRNIANNMTLLVKGFKSIENGDFTEKIHTLHNNDFSYVFEQYNQMASGLSNFLVSFENEYKRRSLAERKHLQSQINPHFLYNSLFYLVSMAENPQAIRKMAKHLGDYYKYRTSTQDLVTIEEEVDFSISYLEIMALRKSIQYKIDFEESLRDELILPLIIQPLIENAIEHGIEKTEGAFQITLSIKRYDEGYKISVEDDGESLPEEAIYELQNKINQKKSDKNSGIGLWNVNHRLIDYYGSQSKLELNKGTELSGLRVSFEIKVANNESFNS